MSDEQFSTTQIMPADVPVLGGDNLIAMAQQAEMRIEAIKRIKKVALAVTNQHDWINQQGKPYLQVSGAEKVARLFGLSWRLNEPTVDMEPDGHYAFIYTGEFSLGTASIEAVGSRSSKDPFFRKRDDKLLAPDEIDRCDVRKSAYTNCIGNGVTRLLGIRNLTWEEVEEFGQFKRAEASRVEYQKRGEMSEEAKGHRDEIRRMILEMSGGKGNAARDQLFNLTSFTTKEGKDVPGKRRLEDLSEKMVAVTCGKVKKAYEVWVAAGSKPTGGDGDVDGIGDIEF